MSMLISSSFTCERAGCQPETICYSCQLAGSAAIPLGVSSDQYGEPMMVDRHARRRGSVQVDAQNLGHCAELPFDIRL